MANDPFQGFEIEVDPMLPANVILAKDAYGIGCCRDGDAEIWIVGYDQWHAMSPEQHQEFKIQLS